jgi:hypothetical protein
VKQVLIEMTEALDAAYVAAALGLQIRGGPDSIERNEVDGDQSGAQKLQQSQQGCPSPHHTGHVMDFLATINNDFEHFRHHVLEENSRFQWVDLFAAGPATCVSWTSSYSETGVRRGGVCQRGKGPAGL